MNEIIWTGEQIEALAALKVRSDWADAGHALLMRKAYNEYGWQLAAVNRDHKAAGLQEVNAHCMGLSLPVYQAARIIEELGF